MRRLAATITALVAAAPAGAQQPGADTPATADAPGAAAGEPVVAVGQSFDYLTSRGRRLRMTLAGVLSGAAGEATDGAAGETAARASDGANEGATTGGADGAADGLRYRWELHDVTDSTQLAARILQDQEFRILRYEQPDGSTTRYQPHNCEKTVGMCRYTLHLPDGSSAEEMRINGIEGDVWNYSLWKERGGSLAPVGVGEICYDAAGLSLTETWTDLESSSGYSIQRIRPDGTLADCATAPPPAR